MPTAIRIVRDAPEDKIIKPIGANIINKTKITIVWIKPTPKLAKAQQQSDYCAGEFNKVFKEFMLQA